jgi:phi13 family phage major tail protein
MTKPLPRIGVDQAYFALLTQDNASGVVYGTPTQMQGVRQIAYNPNPQQEVYYADDGAYTTISQDGDIDMVVTVADLDPAIYATILGVTQSGTNGVIEEDKTDNPPELAFGYRTQKSNGEYRYIWVLKGKFSKPALDAQTKSDSINAQDREINFKGLNRDYDGKKRRRVDSDDDLLPTGVTNAILNDDTTGWFSDPDFQPVAPGTPLSDVAAATGSGSGEIDLTFTAPTGATSVKAQIYDGAYGTWVDATTQAPITAISTSATITGLTASNTYTCRLVVIGGGSNGISNTDSAAAGA